MGLLVYTRLNGGHMDSTWDTHTEYLFRSSTGTMLKSVISPDLRARSIIR